MDLTELLKNLLSGGIGNPTMLLIIGALILFSNKREDETIFDALKRVLGFGPKPNPDAKRINFSDDHDCCTCVVDLARHLEKKGHNEEAAALRALLPKLAEGGHNHG